MRRYTLRDFYVDLRLAFPELQLYTVLLETAKSGRSEVSSGLTPEEEFCRTICSLFSIYWLARIGIDGELGLSFGVDDDWRPRQPPSEGELEHISQMRTRQHFYEHTEWLGLQELLIDARMLMRSADGCIVVGQEMMLAMLVLTVIDDVFKAEALLPKVRPEHAPFNEYKTGDVINDHDRALSYVLQHFPCAMPSYDGLSYEQKRAVMFTTSEMNFNHGWLVQAEAPPQALFANFKKVVEEGQADAAIISFYFVHWFTDLAGACPSPLEGSEQLVVALPHRVVGSFIRSFNVLSDLATETETQVFEAYLETYWLEEVQPGFCEPLPQGDHAIALMRLMCQAQTKDKQTSLLHAWYNLLGPEDKRVLSEEMGRTGLVDQHYKHSRSRRSDGPAILVYYSPHLLRTLLLDTALEALVILAEIYRCARQLWPLTPLIGSQSHTVVVHVGHIKELTVDQLREVYANGDSWLLCKCNEKEAVVECHPIDYITELAARGSTASVLRFWRRREIAFDSASDSGSPLPPSVRKCTRTSVLMGSPSMRSNGSSSSASPSLQSIGTPQHSALMPPTMVPAANWQSRCSEENSCVHDPVPSKRISENMMHPEKPDVQLRRRFNTSTNTVLPQSAMVS
mmetsp:Transcript_579/g.1955  ORF Transcript_579/g.1955 Transcript_579/m.1955 type:complete len:626 (-) Transcript_579:317-2194(-)